MRSRTPSTRQVPYIAGGRRQRHDSIVAAVPALARERTAVVFGQDVQHESEFRLFLQGYV